VQGQAPTSGPRLWVVLGSIAVLSVVLGVFAYWRYVVSERHFARTVVEMDEQGKRLDVDGCIAAVLAWHKRCEANKSLCDQGVPRVMMHCLRGQDRKNDCSELDVSAATAQWVFNRCKDRGTPCANRKSCPCADAYRALDSFCRYDQEGISL